jgi:hypothetical protein
MWEAWEAVYTDGITFAHDFPSERHMRGIEPRKEVLITFTVNTPWGSETLAVTTRNSQPTIRNALVDCVKGIRRRAEKRQAAGLPYK